MKKNFFLFYLVFIFSLSGKESAYPKQIKTKEEKLNYITGNFEPQKYLMKVPNSISNQPKKTFYLRKEVLENYRKLLKDFSKKYPKIKLTLISSFRSFSHQKRIWERKFNSEKKKKKTDKQIIDWILQYSSAPSTSRHHWGTDIDLNSLENSYFETGKGKKIYEWLQKNASKYGFCQPYNVLSKRENKGYNEEKWHWSYFPLAKQLQNEWKKQYLAKKLNFDNKFNGSEILQKKVLNYVTSINKDCIKG